MNTRWLPGLCAMLVLWQPPPAAAWGEDGHRMINGAAVAALPGDVPAFLREAGPRLEFLGPEPDRWRDSHERLNALREASGADHFIDIDDTARFTQVPGDRYRYADWLRKQGKDAADIGFLPYAIIEGYQKLQVLFRLWRDPKHAAERSQIEQNIVYYAGVLGHYVADGSQPLHVTIHYNGWKGRSNPQRYTRDPLHSRFETDYVKARIKPADLRGQVTGVGVLESPFDDVMSFLFAANAEVETLYRLEKSARWEAGNTTPEARRFVISRLTNGAGMLASLWYTAWVDSAKAQGGDARAR